MSSQIFRLATSLKDGVKDGVQGYTETYTKTDESPDYQFGDITKTTLTRAWNGLACGLQRGIIMRATNAEEPATTLMSYINTCRYQNGKEVFTIDEGRGHELWTLLVKRFTPMEVAEFSSSWWSSGIDGEDVWQMPKFKAFRILMPYME
jgi:hypothetical protein